MRKIAGLWALSLLAAAGQTACLSNDRLLVGENGKHDGGGGTGGSGGGGSGGNVADGGPTINRLQHPLPIPAQDALTRMAALIWKAPPDADLLSQAAAGHFVTIEDLYGPARQMLADPRATNGVGDFYNWWLHLPAIDELSKDAALFPTFNSQLASDMHNEVLTFALNVTLAMNGTYQTLIKAPFTFINARLADIYGIGGITGDSLQQVSLNPAQRAGLLTMPGMQALTSTNTRNGPSAHGRDVVQEFLCSAIPPPPANVPPISMPIPAGTTLRHWLEETHASNPACAACHHLIDPYGFAFETFDAIGRARTTDNGAPVDVTNLQLGSDDPPVTINGGAVELARLWSGETKAQECMTRQWLAYALGTDPYGVAANTVAQAQQPFVASGFNLKELIAAVVLTDAFLRP